MKNVKDVAEALSAAASERKMSAKDLAAASGVTPQTLVNILKHHADFRVSNLLSLADRLGLAIVFVPKAAAQGLRAPEAGHTPIRSKVDLALERVRDLSKNEKAK